MLVADHLKILFIKIRLLHYRSLGMYEIDEVLREHIIVALH